MWLYILDKGFEEMKKQIKTLQNVVTRKGSSKALTFSTPHILKSMFLLTEQKYVSRSNFCKELHLGEGAVKTIILHLKENDLAGTVKSGTHLTKKGQRLAKQFLDALPSKTHIEDCKITKGKYNYAILMKKKYVTHLGNGMEQRDYAILYGASDSLTLQFDKKEFLFTGERIRCFSDDPKTRDNLHEKLKPEKGDIVIITSADDKFVAELSALNTALWTLNN